MVAPVVRGAGGTHAPTRHGTVIAPVVVVPGVRGNRVAIAPDTIQKTRSVGVRGTRPSRHRCGMRIAGGMNATRALVRDANRGRHECRPYDRARTFAPRAAAPASRPP